MQFLKRLAIAAGLLAVLALSILYFTSAEKFEKVPEPDPFNYTATGDSAELARGYYVARTRGCFGCHGQSLEGVDFDEEWDWVARGVAPNLSVLAKQHDYATLAAVIRQGISVKGRGLYSMPSYNWVHLTDEDVGALISYLKSVPRVDDDLPRPKLGLKARYEIATGRESLMHELGERVPDLIDVGNDSLLVRGQYLAMTMCNECHGLDLRGEIRRDLSTPDLAIVAGYSWEEFVTLTTEGTAKDGRSLGLMTMIARDRFPILDEQDRRGIYTFLQTLPDRPVPSDVPWRIY